MAKKQIGFLFTFFPLSNPDLRTNTLLVFAKYFQNRAGQIVKIKKKVIDIRTQSDPDLVSVAQIKRLERSAARLMWSL